MPENATISVRRADLTSLHKLTTMSMLAHIYVQPRLGVFNGEQCSEYAAR